MLLPTGDTVPSDSPLLELLDTIWNQQPAPLSLVDGHWRWRCDPGRRDEVHRLLVRRLGPRSVPFEPARAHRLALPPTDPSSRPCEVALYPILVPPRAEPDTDPMDGAVVDLCLFYSMGRPGGEPTPADRDRAYYRVVETLDRLCEATGRENPRLRVRAVDLPMPGWMGAQLIGSSGNRCPLIMT